MNKLKFFLPYTVAGGILYFLFRKFDLTNISSIIIDSHKSFLILASIIFFSTTLILAWRWKKLLNFVGLDIPYLEAYKLYLASIPIAKISPSSSGDMIRAVYLRRKLPVDINLGIILFEIISEFLILSLLCFIGGIIMPSRMAMLTGSGILILILSAWALILKIDFHKYGKIGIYIENLTMVFKKIRRHPGLLLHIFTLTFVSWFMILSGFSILFKALGANMPLSYVFSIQPIVALLSLLPITISGIGVRESAMAYFYAQIIPADKILAAGLSFSFLSVFLLPMLCLPFLFIVLKTKNSEINK